MDLSNFTWSRDPEIKGCLFFLKKIQLHNSVKKYYGGDLYLWFEILLVRALIEGTANFKRAVLSVWLVINFIVILSVQLHLGFHRELLYIDSTKKKSFKILS